MLLERALFKKSYLNNKLTKSTELFKKEKKPFVKG